MNKIVMEHYPVSQLPQDLRQAVGDVENVTLTIEAEGKPEPGSEKPSVIGWYEKYELIHRDNFKTPEEVNDWVRSLREEWSHRER